MLSSVTLKAQIPDDLAESLTAIARSDDRSPEALVEEALSDYVRRRRELDEATVEGLEAIRKGEVHAHEHVRRQFEGWGN